VNTEYNYNLDGFEVLIFELNLEKFDSIIHKTPDNYSMGVSPSGRYQMYSHTEVELSENNDSRPITTTIYELIQDPKTLKFSLQERKKIADIRKYLGISESGHYFSGSSLSVTDDIDIVYHDIR